MARSIGVQFVGNTLQLCALGCGVTGILLLPIHPMVGLALCTVAVADLGLVWLLRTRSPAPQAEADLPSG